MKGATSPGRFSVMRFVRWLVCAPLFAIVGAVVVVAYLPRFVRWLKRLRSFWADTLTCPNGHSNVVATRWECSTCHGQYHGWVGKCGVCGSEDVDWFPCEICDLAVVLPWRRFD
jgi:hypothetical protein